MSVWILDHVRLHRCESFAKLWETQLGITIEIKSTHDRGELLFHWLMADALQKSPDRALVDDLEVLIVDRLESSPDAEAIELLEVLLELLQSQLEIDLLRKKDSQLFLYHGLQILELRGSSRRSLCHIRA